MRLLPSRRKSRPSIERRIGASSPFPGQYLFWLLKKSCLARLRIPREQAVKIASGGTAGDSRANDTGTSSAREGFPRPPAGTRNVRGIPWKTGQDVPLPPLPLISRIPVANQTPRPQNSVLKSGLRIKCSCSLPPTVVKYALPPVVGILFSHAPRHLISVDHSSTGFSSISISCLILI